MLCQLAGLATQQETKDVAGLISRFWLGIEKTESIVSGNAQLWMIPKLLIPPADNASCKLQPKSPGATVFLKINAPLERL